MSQVTEYADTMTRFLKEPAVKDTFAALRKLAYDSFRSATTDAQLRDAHALALAIDLMETAFRAVMDAGERERLDEQSAERQLATR